ncbi:MAG: LTA synthase family protein [Lentisphaeraceae bacterium]|nr:LTA synthase family protein [Lentisphaeraceae bacterium]
MTLIFASITLLTGLLFWLLKDNLNKVIEHPLNIKKRMVAISVYVLLFFTILTAVDQSTKDVFDNSYQSELASNGPYQFVAAFRNNELAYKKFYTSISDIDAAKIIRKELSIQNEEEGSFDIYRSTKFPQARKKVNVFMVMVESLSSDYLQYFGNEEGITPHLDNLIKDSVFFDKLYATGTRTTRGLEAVTLSIPPTPGRSIVKRLGRETGFCSLGNILNENDYNVNFIYGGRGYFDNINAFFTGNGYGIIDQASTPSEEISFSNAWGMSDEDLFSQAIKSADDSHKKGKLFFSHVMTSSNHRPFTYPENRIDIPSGTGRSGAVKYSDWAIKDLLEKASKKPWFKDTLFIIIADHQANSAGKVDLPLERYHIPMWFYSPGHIKPQIVNKVCSQIDLAPTILAWLGIDYSAPFFGKDIFKMKANEERALIGTYQHLGLYKDHTMAVLGPQKKVHIHKEADSVNPDVSESDINDPLIKLCISYYQSASEIYKTNLNAWSRRLSPRKVAVKK